MGPGEGMDGGLPPSHQFISLTRLVCSTFPLGLVSNLTPPSKLVTNVPLKP
jgi:hypothetical protein